MTFSKIFFNQAYIFGLSIIGTAAYGKTPKLNVLFIAVDDLKPELGCYGNKMIKTPNIDRIAKSGTVFLQNYCQQAVSGPTRASLMTGMRPDYTKVWDLKTKMRDVNPEILTLPQYFASKGYMTTGVGKIFDSRCVDNDMDKPSWSIPYNKVAYKYYNAKTGQPLMGNYHDPLTKKLIIEYHKEAEEKGLKGKEIDDYISKRIKPSTECIEIPDDAYTDGAGVKLANELLYKLSKQNKPFFFAVGFSKPHLPFVAPKKYWDLYKRKKMPIASFQEHSKNGPEIAYQSTELKTYSDIPALCSFTDNPKNIGLNIEKQKELIHGYYASISYMDAQVGKLIHTLDSLDLTKNTIIVLWGDHGWHLGDHGLWCKHTNFENATRAPLIISAPGMKPGSTKSLTEFVDLFPTLCELAKLPIPEKLDGKSLLPLILNQNDSVKEFAVSQYPRENNTMGYSIRTERYRLSYWIKDDFRSSQPFNNNLLVTKELYDYQADPFETTNVADDPKYAKILGKLEAKMTAFLKSQEVSHK